MEHELGAYEDAALRELGHAEDQHKANNRANAEYHLKRAHVYAMLAAITGDEY